MLTELTNQNYNELISADKPLVIEFYSPTCVHCKRTEAGLNEAAEELGKTAIIAKCDITSQPDLAKRYDVTALPTLLFIKNGVNLVISLLASLGISIELSPYSNHCFAVLYLVSQCKSA